MVRKRHDRENSGVAKQKPPQRRALGGLARIVEHPVGNDHPEPSGARRQPPDRAFEDHDLRCGVVVSGELESRQPVAAELIWIALLDLVPKRRIADDQGKRRPVGIKKLVVEHAVQATSSDFDIGVPILVDQQVGLADSS